MVEQLCESPECTHQASKFIVHGLNFMKLCQRHLYTLPYKSTYDIKDLKYLFGEEISIRDTASQYVQRATEELSNNNYKEALSFWKQAVTILTLRFSKEKLTAKTCFELGKQLIKLWCNFPDAEKPLKLSFEIERELDSTSIPTMKSGVQLLSSLLHREAWKKARSIAEFLVSVCRIHYPGSKLHYKSMCYLSLVYQEQSDTRAENLMKECCIGTLKHFPKEKSTALILWLSTKIERLFLSRRKVKLRREEALHIWKLHETIPLERLDLLYEVELDSENATYRYLYDIEESRYLDPSSPLIPKMLLIAAKACSKFRIYRAETVFQEAVKTCKNDDPNSMLIADALYEFGIFYQEQGKHSQAIDLFLEAIQIYWSHHPTSQFIYSKSTKKWVSLKPLQHCYHCICRLAKGCKLDKTERRFQTLESLYQDALDTCRTQGKRLKFMRVFAMSLGKLFECGNLYKEAEVLYGEILELYRAKEKVLPGAELLLDTLSELYLIQHQYGSSERLLTDTLAICRVQDANSRLTQHLVSALENSYQNRPAELERLYKETLATSRALDPMSSFAYDLVKKLGLAYEREKRYEAALALYMDTLTCYRLHDLVSSQAIDMTWKVSTLYRKMAKFIDMETFLKSTLTLLKANSGHSVHIRDFTLSLGSWLESTHRYDEAERLYQEALLYGQEHDLSALLFHGVTKRLASLYCTFQRFLDAENLLKTALTMYWTDWNNLTLAEDMTMWLGTFYICTDRCVEADALYRDAFARYKSANSYEPRHLFFRIEAFLSHYTGYSLDWHRIEMRALHQTLDPRFIFPYSDFEEFYESMHQFTELEHIYKEFLWTKGRTVGYEEMNQFVLIYEEKYEFEEAEYVYSRLLATQQWNARVDEYAKKLRDMYSGDSYHQFALGL